MLNKKMKICVVITARPSYSRVKSLLLAIKRSSRFDLQIVLAASALLDKFGKVEEEIINDGFSISYRVHNLVETDNDPSSMGITTGLGIVQLTQLFTQMRPDIVVTIADRFETLATSVAASYSGITLIHIQGGEITGNIDERVRHANTKLADIHFASCASAKQVILNMGENPSYVFNAGCPSLDLIANMKDLPAFVLQKEIDKKGVGSLISISNPFLVSLLHPVTTELQSSEEQATQLLHTILSTDIPCFWFWPNADAGTSGTSRALRKFREENPNNKFRFIKNLSPETFISLLKRSIGLLGNSSSGIRECSFLGVPVVNIGSRQNGRERGPNVIDVGNNEKEISAALQSIISIKKHFDPSYIYGHGDSGERICQILTELELPNGKMFNLI